MARSAPGTKYRGQPLISGWSPLDPTKWTSMCAPALRLTSAAAVQQSGIERTMLMAGQGLQALSSVRGWGVRRTCAFRARSPPYQHQQHKLTILPISHSTQSGVFPFLLQHLSGRTSPVISTRTRFTRTYCRLPAISNSD